jgi:hypothetical protein
VSHTANGQNGWNVSSPVTENVSASDATSGLGGTPACTADGHPATLTVTGGGWTFPVSGDGVHAISCSVSDIAGSQTTAGDTAKIDTTAPSLVATHAANGQNGWNVTSPVTETISASDAGSGLTATPACTVDGNAASLTAAGGGTWKLAVSGDGVHAISCAMSDQAGNPQSAGETVKIDTTAPTLTPSVSPSVIALNGSATATPNASDGGSGLASSSCVALDTSSDGVKTETCSATDKAGNTASATATYTVYRPLNTGNTTCNGVYGGSGQSVTVPNRGSCMLVSTAQITQNVQVGQGATLTCAGATIGQDLQVNQAAGVGLRNCQVGHDAQIQGLTGPGPGAGGDSYICSTTIGHDLQVQNNAGGGAFVIGYTPDCSGSNPSVTVAHDVSVQNNAQRVDVSNVNGGHDLTVQNNTAGVSLSADHVLHDMTVQNNSGGTAISNNTAGNNAQCQNNKPAATGSSNAAGSQNQGCPA